MDLHDYVFAPRQIAECTEATPKDLENYMQHKHVTPNRDSGKPRFSAFQMIEVDLIARLASLFRIPPSVGAQIARKMLIEAPVGMLESETRSAGRMTAPCTFRGRVTVLRHEDGNVEVAKSDDDDTIDLVVPVQLFARMVLARAQPVTGSRPEIEVVD